MSRLNKVVIAVSIIAGLVASGAIAYPVLFQDNNSTPIDPGLTTTPKTLEEFYAQTPLWSDCEGNNTEARCGFIQVPLNWSKPEQGAQVCRRPIELSQSL